MNPTISKLLVIIPFSFAVGTGLLFGQADPMVTYQTNTTLLHEAGGWVPLTHDLDLQRGITVFTNGTFRLNEGKPRKLKEGQILRADGFLLNPDGSTLPVIDHISMHGSVRVFKDGEGTPLAGSITLSDGSVVESDGSYTRPNARRSRLRDGQLVALDGTPIDGIDTISYKNGQVAACKSGTMISLQPAPNIILGMFDGTRVSGDGAILAFDGSRRQLAEGEVLAVPGVRAEW
jgi:hypothetical protein